MPHYYEWATGLPIEEVRATLDALARKELHPREAKRKLARTITAELRSPAEAEEAEREFDRVHKERAAPADTPSVDVSANGAKEIGIVDLLVIAQLETSKGNARRVVEQGGVKVNGQKADLTTAVPTKGEALIQVGPRRSKLVRFR
jgi:tyrosyl-tRNA synthetase